MNAFFYFFDAGKAKIEGSKLAGVETLFVQATLSAERILLSSEAVLIIVIIIVWKSIVAYTVFRKTEVYVVGSLLRGISFLSVDNQFSFSFFFNSNYFLLL